jgi:hypothetical protein
MKALIELQNAMGTPISAKQQQAILKGCVEHIPTTSYDPSATSGSMAQDPSLPPLMIRGINFASAMIRWAGAGFPTRTKREISKLLAICQSCEHLKDNHCQLCGCPCNENNQLRNKLALKSEKCPIGRW